MSELKDTLRLQPSLKAAAEKLSAMQVSGYSRKRAAGERGAFLDFLDGAGDEEPCEGDVLTDPGEGASG